MTQYYSFDELKDQLGLSEDEIKKMVSEGELRAFRDEDKMKFKREDVEALQRTQNTGGALDDDDIILLDDDDGDAGGDFTDELVLEDDDDFAVGGTEPLDTQDTFVEGVVGGVTEPIEVIDDEDDDEADMPPAATGSRRMAARGSASRRTVALAQPTTGTPWVTGVQVAICVVMLYGGTFVVGLLSDSNTPATEWLSDKMYEMVNKAPPAKRSLDEGR